MYLVFGEEYIRMHGYVIGTVHPFPNVVVKTPLTRRNRLDTPISARTKLQYYGCTLNS
jgi:hypothetical protein